MNTETISQELVDFVNSIAYIGASRIPYDDGEIYYSKVDGSYLSRVGMEDGLNFLFKRGITEQIQDGYGEPKTACIGFNPVEQKWYGWSHRAIYSFGIGSEIKKGHAGYIAASLEDYIEWAINFWSDEAHVNVAAIPVTNEKGEKGLQVTWEYIPEKVPNKDLHGTIGETFSYLPKEFGKGEWKAETIEDAKQMAIDFAKSVS